jgi:hypothetical protein
MKVIRNFLNTASDKLLGHRTDRLEDLIHGLQPTLDRNALLTGAILSRDVRRAGIVNNIADVEFSVFSQGGEDGIIQYLLGQVPVDNCCFVEFGVEHYRQANTRFLLMQNNWRGLVLDGDKKNIRRIRQSMLYVHYGLQAVQAFIDRENINNLIRESGIAGDIGLLSVDIDGNDYWVWQAIEVISPRIVVVEYNATFGCRHSITVPYDSDFVRQRAHYSYLYFGASLPALVALGKAKGYSFVGCSSNGVNAFFVRNDVVGSLRVMTAEEGFKPNYGRESRDEQGRLTYLDGDARWEIIGDLPIYDLYRKKIEPLAAIMVKH